MSAHTPGPWKLTKRSGFWCIDPNEGDREYVIRHEANARLIAAAPELLAALKLLVKAEWASCDKFGAREIDRLQKALAVAEAAIAKAGGAA